MKNISALLSVLLVLSACASGQEIKELTPQEAFEMVKNESTYIIDIRSVAEYVFVGHPEMAYSIPTAFWNEKKQGFETNERFMDNIKSRFGKNDTLIFICRSGGRSRRASAQALQAGYLSVYHISEGFEGQKDGQSYRTVDGWKNSGLPYTYTVKPELAYEFPKEK